MNDQHPQGTTLRLHDDNSASTGCAERCTWASRHPWLAFIFGAPALFIICVTLYTIFLAVSGSVFKGRTVENSPNAIAVYVAAAKGTAFVPPIAAAAWLCWRVGRSGRKHRWAVAGCCLIGMLAACLIVDCVPPQSQPGTGRLTIGLGLGQAMPLSQAIGPFLVGFLFVAANTWRRSRPTNQTAQPAALKQAA